MRVGKLPYKTLIIIYKKSNKYFKRIFTSDIKGRKYTEECITYWFKKLTSNVKQISIT